MNNKKHVAKSARKRQWGTEKRTQPLPSMHDKPSILKVSYSRIAIILTVSLWILYVISTILRQFLDGPSTFQFTMEAIGYLVVVTFLTFSALMYLITRQGAFQRFSTHVRVPRSKLDEYFSKNKLSITVLIPSYSEEPEVIRKTIMSAALQEYPGMRVVLLVDDSPNQSTPKAEAQLNATRRLASEIMELFSEPRTRLSKAFKDFDQKHSDKNLVDLKDVRELITHYRWVIDWLENLADNEKREDHVDEFFIEQVVRGLSNELKLVADALSASCEEGVKLPLKRINQLYQRLIWIFDADLDIFERKKYASLSHEANKAMNLNSYIGLMGGTYRPKETPAGTMLLPVTKTHAGDITIPDSDFLLTLDADSILLREYCLRLVYFLEQPDNAKVAVTQTPYSSFRGAETRIERLAGATTDIQHILHQGMSYYNAAFWVGANAVIRKCALEDIAETAWVGGFEIHRYIQDRTVIEDTESSIDLSMLGSLIVQRRRWANGGLLILPKFLSQIRDRKRRGDFVSQMEIMIRINYMASIAWSSFGLIFLLAFPYDSMLLSPLILLAALPYFMAMASDLKYCGYKRSDVLRIYGFNLILLPVNLAGVLKSFEQAITGNKIPFARTPKVKDRTLTPIFYIITPLLIVGFSLFTLGRDEVAHNWGNAAFAAFNAFVASWAIIAYIGIINGIVDLWRGFVNWFYVDTGKKTVKVPQKVEPEFDWRSILYYGDINKSMLLNETSTVNTYPIYTQTKEGTL